jgi:hypothetical protein
VKVFNDELLLRARAAGLRVVVWTVNEPATMHRLLDRGVAGIITDRPDLLRKVLIARGQWPTPDTYGWSPTVWISSRNSPGLAGGRGSDGPSGV